MSSPTLHDVARHCNVSIQTASSILNKDSGKYRAETRQKVLAAAAELGYRPNLVARGLRRGKTNMLGVIISGFSTSYVAAWQLQSIERAAHEQGYRILVGSAQQDPRLVSRHMQDFLGLSVDGLIYWATSPEADQAVQRIGRGGTPLVVIDPPVAFETPVVRTNREWGGYLQVKHLYDIGRTRIAYLLTTVSHYKGAEKLNGIRRALAEVGGEMEPQLTVSRGSLEGRPAEVGAAMVSSLLDAGRQFDAVLTCSDATAMGAMHELIRRGKRVPQDVAIVGFDDDFAADAMIVPLTTIHQPRDIGTQVMDLLSQQMDGKVKPDAALSVDVRPHLVVRASTRIGEPSR